MDELSDQTLQLNTASPRDVATSNISNSNITTTTHIDTVNVHGVQDGARFARDMVGTMRTEGNFNSATAMTSGVGLN
jgi:hypothetical protein